LKNGERLTPEQLHGVATSIMTPGQKTHFDKFHEVDLAYSIAGLGRFRVNAFMQRGTVGIVFRVIPFGVKTIEQLVLPKVVERVAMEARGLILVTGTTGSGKSTTLAAMIDYINTNRTCHIITIEDPIEFLIRDKRSIVNQREIGVDTNSFATALRAALRQDPDVILVGEMRDLETIRLALTGAETGHLVFGTLHTSSAAKTIDRVVDVFPAAEKEMVRAMLSESIRAVISQTLLKTKDGSGRIAAHEIMIGTPAIRNLIRENKIAQMYSAIQTGRNIGMQTLDQNLQELVQKNVVSSGEARGKAANKDMFAG
jgi:twitching motility protein PilT